MRFLQFDNVFADYNASAYDGYTEGSDSDGDGSVKRIAIDILTSLILLQRNRTDVVKYAYHPTRINLDSRLLLVFKNFGVILRRRGCTEERWME